MTDEQLRADKLPLVCVGQLKKLLSFVHFNENPECRDQHIK